MPVIPGQTIGTTPPFVDPGMSAPQGGGQVRHDLFPALLQVLSKIRAAAIPTAGGTPAQGGGPPPTLAGGPPSVNPGGLPIPTGQGSMLPQGGVAVPQHQLSGNPYVPIPAPQSSGVAFPDARAAKAAAAHDFVTNITAVLNTHQERQHQKDERAAKLLLDEIDAARTRGDRQRLYELLDPTTTEGRENQKILKKAGLSNAYEVGGKQAKQQQGPPEPAALALQKKVNEIMGRPDPVAIAQAQAQYAHTQAQTQAEQQRAAQEAATAHYRDVQAATAGKTDLGPEHTLIGPKGEVIARGGPGKATQVEPKLVPGMVDGKATSGFYYPDPKNPRITDGK